MPRPTRRLACLEPAPGLMVLSSMMFSSARCLEHLHQVRDLVDHAAHCGRVFELALAVELAQTEATHRRAVRFLGAGNALDQLDLDGFLVSHFNSPDPASAEDLFDRQTALGSDLSGCARRLQSVERPTHEVV